MNNPQPHPSLSRIGKVFSAIALLATIAAFATTIFAILNQRDTLLQIISFSLGFVSLVVAIIEVFPSAIGFTQQILRDTIFHILMVIIVIIALCLIPLGFIVLQEPTIKIGVTLPFTTEDRKDAIPMLNGIKLAVNEETGGSERIGKYTLQLVPVDDAAMDFYKIQPVWEGNGNPKGNIADFTTITGDAQIAGIIGPFNSGVAIHEIPPTNKASIALISPATTADCLTTLTNFKKDNFEDCAFSGLDKNAEKTFFRLPSPDSIRAEMLAGYFWQTKVGKGEERTGKDAVIFDDRSFFGRTFANRLQEAWESKMHKKVPIIDLTNNPQDDLKKLDFKPDVILFAGTGSKAIALYYAMKTTGYSDTTFASSSSIMRGGLADSSAKGDIYAVSPYGYFDESQQYGQFSSRYKTTYSDELTPYSAGAYDATMILLKSIKEALKFKNPPVASWDILFQADQFRTEVIRAIKRLNIGNFQFTGATGTYHFDPNGDAIGGNNEKEATIYMHTRGSNNLWEHVPYTPEQ